MEKILLSLNEAAAYLKMPVNSLYKLTSSRRIPHFKPGKRLLFDKAQLDEWLEQHYICSRNEMIS